MLSKIKELLRWIIFIPAPFIAGPAISSLLFILILLITKGFGENLVDIPSKLMLTSTMWVAIYWFGALLKPRNLSFKSFRIIWIISITIAVISFLNANSSYDWRYQLLEIFIPIYFFLYRGDYEDQKSFIYAVNFRITRVFGFDTKEERLPGAVGWSLPTLFFALCLLIESLFLTFNGLPFALLSFLGAVCLNTAVSTALYTKNPYLSFQKNQFIKRFLCAIAVWILGALLIRVSGLDSINFLTIPLNLYILPSFLGVIYFPGDDPKDLANL